MKTANPFLLSGYISKEYFCDRENETGKILEAIQNNRNITIYSQRRIGKTVLINHVFHSLKSDKNKVCIYLDVLSSNSFNEFVNVFGNAIINSIETKPEKFYKKVKELFMSFRPVITIDSLTGLPSFQLTTQSKYEAEKSIEGLFNYLRSQKKKIVIAIDEFQQISQYPENNIEALLRTNIQKLTNTTFIFSGSKKHLLLSMFEDKNRPFFKSTQLMKLDKIDKNVYSDFIISSFAKSDKRINKEQTNIILEWVNLQTFYVQYICNRIFSKNAKQISESIINETFIEILEEQEIVFINYRNLLTEYQWRILRAVASEGIIKSVLSKHFISKYNLNTPSSVKTAVDSLITKDILINDISGYYIQDVLFQKWLERN
ncbi:MAG: ATP-binding protein [Ignavibacteriaceae bacterium]|nr:ATP-binding protein [Ignavibacteriaceae bacterium]HMN23608.1 ATP-binding protein [Ignavibacteriaceae bacterium]